MNPFWHVFIRFPSISISHDITVCLHMQSHECANALWSNPGINHQFQPFLGPIVIINATSSDDIHHPHMLGLINRKVPSKLLTTSRCGLVFLNKTAAKTHEKTHAETRNRPLEQLLLPSLHFSRIPAVCDPIIHDPCMIEMSCGGRKIHLAWLRITPPNGTHESLISNNYKQFQNVRIQYDLFLTIATMTWWKVITLNQLSTASHPGTPEGTSKWWPWSQSSPENQ